MKLFRTIMKDRNLKPMLSFVLFVLVLVLLYLVYGRIREGMRPPRGGRSNVKPAAGRRIVGSAKQVGGWVKGILHNPFKTGSHRVARPGRPRGKASDQQLLTRSSSSVSEYDAVPSRGGPPDRPQYPPGYQKFTHNPRTTRQYSGGSLPPTPPGSPSLQRRASSDTNVDSDYYDIVEPLPLPLSAATVPGPSQWQGPNRTENTLYESPGDAVPAAVAGGQREQSIIGRAQRRQAEYQRESAAEQHPNILYEPAGTLYAPAEGAIYARGSAPRGTPSQVDANNTDDMAPPGQRSATANVKSSR